MTQHEDRIQQRMDKATAKRHQGEWVKHTINLRKGTTLNTRMQECGNKSHLVRETFKRFLELKHEIDHLREENTIMRENIAKLQARLVEDEVVEAKMHPDQSTLDGKPKPTALEQWRQIQMEEYE
jgi:regulator of replication initiation timing